MAYKQFPDFVLKLICAGELSKNDMRVYSALILHVRGNLGSDGRLVWPSRATLMRESGVNNYARLTDSLANLAALGCIVMTSGGGRKESGTGRANKYFLPKMPIKGQNVPASRRDKKKERAGKSFNGADSSPDDCKPGQNVICSPEQAGTKRPDSGSKPGQNVPTKPGQNVPTKPGQNVPTIQNKDPDEKNQGQPSAHERRCPHCGSTLEADGWCKSCGWLEV